MGFEESSGKIITYEFPINGTVHSVQEFLKHSDKDLKTVKKIFNSMPNTKNVNNQTEFKLYMGLRNIDYAYLYSDLEWLVNDGNGFYSLEDYIKNNG